MGSKNACPRSGNSKTIVRSNPLRCLASHASRTVTTKCVIMKLYYRPFGQPRSATFSALSVDMIKTTYSADSLAFESFFS